MPEIPYEALVEKASVFAPKLGAALAIFSIGWIIARILRNTALKVFSKTGLEQSLSKFFSRIIYLLILVVSLVTALQQMGVETTSIIAVLGAMSLAVGLALQDSLSNFAAGVTILVLRPFKIGDYISGAGIEGTVKDINLFSTELATVENLKIVVPNSKLSSDVIKNYSANRTRRIDLIVGIGYDSSIVKAKTILEEILKKEPKVLNSPQWLIAVGELGDYSVNLVLRVWVKNENYWDIRFSLLNEIKNSFDKEGIEIPYPKREVFMKQVANS